MVGRRSRVLIVDDCGDTVEILSTLLEMLGHEARGAKTGASALAEAEAFEPDLVLLDLVLPDISGFSVASELRKRSRRDVYLAALTGRGTARDRARCRDAGFDEHLLKPVDRSGICNVIERAALTKTAN
jgi:CheY-like chemotaxis protein